MTIPWLMNCPHSSDSWCLSCVEELGLESENLRRINADAAKLFEAEIASMQRLVTGLRQALRELSVPVESEDDEPFDEEESDLRDDDC